jgi:hypothetical protein
MSPEETIDGALFDTSVIAPPALLTRMSTGPSFFYRLDRFLSSVPIGYVNLQAEALHACAFNSSCDRGCAQLLAKLRGAIEVDIQYCNVGSGLCQAQSMRGPGHAPLLSRSQLFLGGSWITAQWICSPGAACFLMNEAMRSMAWRPSGKTAAKNGHMWIISSTPRDQPPRRRPALLAKRVESSISTSTCPPEYATAAVPSARRTAARRAAFWCPRRRYISRICGAALGLHHWIDVDLRAHRSAFFREVGDGRHAYAAGRKFVSCLLERPSNVASARPPPAESPAMTMEVAGAPAADPSIGGDSVVDSRRKGMLGASR